MKILGINYIFHDSSACVVFDGTLLAAIEEERLSRRKHSQEFPKRAIARCLELANLKVSDITHIAISANPKRHAFRKLAYMGSLASKMSARTLRLFVQYEYTRLRERHGAFWEWFHATWRGSQRPEVHFIDHHMAHVGGSFYVSPYNEAALLSLDGWGEWSTSWLGSFEGGRLNTFGESMFPHSLGCFYSAATEFCGFKPNYDEGKTMGLAPTGDATRFSATVSKLVRVTEDGQIELDLSHFKFQNGGAKFCSNQFYEVFGEPRKPGAPIDEYHKDVAAAFQEVLETRILELCRVLERRTTARHLILAGGVALNSVANGRVLRETRFDDIYVMPGAGDNGTCIGAAYFLYNHKLGATRRYHHQDPFLGSAYRDEEIRGVLEACKLEYRQAEDVCVETARLVADGLIVGWFQGRMEFGPRSLGNRSILADPTDPDMKDRVNAQVKHREAFRPFAPSVPVEDSQTYFSIQVDSPFMLKVCDVLPSQRSRLPAITHVDGTARLQTVDKRTNPLFHRLLREFGKLSGVPVLLNTSFNVMDEPVVESPIHALRCFFSTGLDALVMGNMILTKQRDNNVNEYQLAVGHQNPILELMSGTTIG
ncbi:MAG TPA: carbamoyltransferase C-terminal domain-containing protein [Bryobacteraceae bacterium]|nr:carbamoyltransferase C-terminal domain-containing protein [Bryobacteraceae bacterium]